MTPIFDLDNHVVAFFDGTWVFDLDNDWIAFHENGHVFANGGAWLGPLQHGSFLDREGQPVAWLVGTTPTAGMKPSAPLNGRRPLLPKRPLRPRTPLPPPRPLPPGGGWSKVSWAHWIRAGAVVGPALVDADSLRLEPIAEADHAAFFRYLGHQLAENGRDGVWFEPTPPTDAGMSPERRQGFRDGLATPVGDPGWRRGWIASDARGDVAGHVDLRAHPAPFTGHRCLLGMGVRRDHRRIGLASRLLAHAVQWAAGQGLRWIDLHVLSANAPAVALYRREGFQMLGGRPDMFVVDGVSLGEIWMSRKITAGT